MERLKMVRILKKRKSVRDSDADRTKTRKHSKI